MADAPRTQAGAGRAVDDEHDAATGRTWWELDNSAGGIVVVVILVVVVAAFGLVRWATNPSLCDVLAARPADMPSVEWDNGFTSSQATWFTVLTEGVQYGDEPTRQAMAEAVLKDGAGFEAILDRIPAEDRPALERLRPLALHPDAGRSLADDPATERDRRVLYDRKAEANCAWM